MNTKKRLAASLLAVMTAAVLVLPASAHCHGGGGHHGVTQPAVAQPAVQTATVALCPVEGCDVLGHHTHDGTTYCGYQHTSGSCDGEHQLCAVEGCATVGEHSHSSEKCRTTHDCHSRYTR